MILDQNKIAEACRYLDAKSEEFGPESFDLVVRQLDIDVGGMLYVAEQRGLRTAMFRDDQDPRKLSRSEFTKVKLSAESRAEMFHYTATWIDGFVAGVAAEQARNR